MRRSEPRPPRLPQMREELVRWRGAVRLGARVVVRGSGPAGGRGGDGGCAGEVVPTNWKEGQTAARRNPGHARGYRSGTQGVSSPGGMRGRPTVVGCRGAAGAEPYGQPA
jgi:hypothetical protein